MRINTAVIAGLGVVALWASAFPAIRVAAPDLGVAGLSFVRLATASIVLLACATARRPRAPRRRDLGWIIACGFFGMAAYQLLLNQSELHVPAGTASIIVAAAPLVSVAVARVLFDERITPFTVVGSIVALGGLPSSACLVSGCRCRHRCGSSSLRWWCRASITHSSGRCSKPIAALKLPPTP